MKRLVVTVDPDLSDLMPGFLANKRADAGRIMAASAAADFAALRGLGHRIKGEGGSYGFDDISEIGAELERAAVARDTDAIRQCGERLNEYLQSLELVFK